MESLDKIVEWIEQNNEKIYNIMMKNKRTISDLQEEVTTLRETVSDLQGIIRSRGLNFSIKKILGQIKLFDQKKVYNLVDYDVYINQQLRMPSTIYKMRDSIISYEMVGTNQINFIKNDGNQTAWKDLQDDSTLLDPSSEDGNRRMKKNADKKKEVVMDSNSDNDGNQRMRAAWKRHVRNKEHVNHNNEKERVNDTINKKFEEDSNSDDDGNQRMRAAWKRHVRNKECANDTINKKFEEDSNQTAWKDLQDDSTLLDPSSEDGNRRMKRNADKKKEDRKNVEKVKESEDDFAFSIK